MLKKDENKKINTFNYIDIFIYDIQIANISIRFFDIIDGIYQSFFELYIIDTAIEMLQNSNPKDSTNLLNYLKNTFSSEKKELNTYDKNNFYIYLNALTNIEMKTLNNYLNEWEYFIEPFSIKFYYCQFLKRMRPNIDIHIPNMININLSLNFAKILAFTLQKFSMNIEEAKKNKKGKLFKDEKSNETNYLGIESPILIFENYTGVDMEIWFDNIKYEANSDLIIKLENNKKFELTNGLLRKYHVTKKHKNLNTTISYKFCIDNNNFINEKSIIGNNFNINYHHIDMHDINDIVKISIECCSDNLLCRHIFFNSLISIKNNTKFKDLQLCNNKQKIELKNNEKQILPISWFLSYDKNIEIFHNNESKILINNIYNINDNNNVKKYLEFNNDLIIIDIIRYTINLDEYYSYKNTNDKKEIYRIDIILSPPITLINSTPYDFFVNSIDKIGSNEHFNIYNNNLTLLSKYIESINNTGKKTKKKNEKDIVFQIIKDIKLQIKYQNILLSVISIVEEKNGKIEEDKNEEGKSLNNFASYNNNLSILLKNQEIKTYLICRLFFKNPYESISYNSKIYKSMKVQLNSFNYEIIFDYYFVNRTNQDLYLKNKYLENINTKGNHCKIWANRYTPISKVLLKKKIKLRNENEKWSDKFEASAIGEEFTLNIKKDEMTYYSYAMKIRISNLFTKSITIIIEDKYIIMNDLPFDIVLKEDKLSTITKIKSNENRVLLLNKESLKKKNNYRIGVKKCYSHMFDIDKLGAFDLLINYNEKVFQDEKIDVEDKLIELNNTKYYPVRCIINPINKNGICIIFSYNKEYINQFRNHTPSSVEIILNKDKTKKYIVKPEKTIPLIYFNEKGRYEYFEKVEIKFDDNFSEKVKINEIVSKFTGKNKDYVIRIQPDNNNLIKCIKVYKKNDGRLRNEIYIKNIIKKYTRVTGANIKLSLFGIGFSLINEIPKEIFYLSIYGIYLCYKFSNVVNILGEVDDYNSLLFSIKNMQLDYCLDNSYDIVFNPTNQILPAKFDEKEKEKKEEKNFLDKVLEREGSDTPFIQFVISQKVRHVQINNKNKMIYSLYPEIALFIQEFDVRINTILINALISNINEYLQIFSPFINDNDNKDLKKIKNGSKGMNNGNNLINDYNINNNNIIKNDDKDMPIIYNNNIDVINNDNNLIINNNDNNIIENDNLIININDNNFNDDNIINDYNLMIDNNKNESLIKIKNKLLNKDGNITNLVINNLTLSAIKINTTFKVNKNAIDIKYVPEIFITLLNTLCSSLSSFSDVILRLGEISFSNVFSDIDLLSDKLITYYKNKFLIQIYKIVLNIDLLGNPINLLEGIGTGIFQLFNEPRKGLLKGPEEFGLGLTRGAKALVSNVVGGSFNSVSKITGTILNTTKNLSSIGTEEEIIVKEEEKAKGLLSGTISGFKKGFGELTHGFAGIVTKPIKQTKKSGVKGFFKGLGSGLVGAALAPVSAVLTVGNEVTSGISNSEFISNKKRIRRFRIPRTLHKYLPISPYDEKYEYEIKKQKEKSKKSNKAMVISLTNEKLYLENSKSILMCVKLEDSSNVIVTDVMIKVLDKEFNKFVRKIYVYNVKELKENENNKVELIMKNENSIIFNFQDEKNKASFIEELNIYLI